MKIAFLLISVVFTLFNGFQDDKCKYESILEFKENEKITYKQVTKLSYYSQSSRFAIRRNFREIDIVFSSVFGLEDRRFESFKDREKLQSYFQKKDYIIRIQFEIPEGKLAEGKFNINKSPKDSMKCVMRLYHLDKTKQGMKVISRKYEVKTGELEIEKLSASTFCGKLELEIPEYYNLSSSFSVKAITRED